MQRREGWFFPRAIRLLLRSLGTGNLCIASERLHRRMDVLFEGPGNSPTMRFSLDKFCCPQARHVQCMQQFPDGFKGLFLSHHGREPVNACFQIQALHHHGFDELLLPPKTDHFLHGAPKIRLWIQSCLIARGKKRWVAHRETCFLSGKQCRSKNRFSLYIVDGLACISHFDEGLQMRILIHDATSRFQRTVIYIHCHKGPSMDACSQQCIDTIGTAAHIYPHHGLLCVSHFPNSSQLQQVFDPMHVIGPVGQTWTQVSFRKVPLDAEIVEEERLGECDGGFVAVPIELLPIGTRSHGLPMRFERRMTCHHSFPIHRSVAVHVPRMHVAMATRPCTSVGTSINLRHVRDAFSR